MRNISLSVAILFLSAAFLPGKPINPKEPPKENKKELIKLMDKCQFGTVTLVGDKVTINGGSHWYADGQVLPNGKVVLYWRTFSDNREAPASYELKDDQLIGAWGWADCGVEVNTEGLIFGMTSPEKLYEVK